MLSPRRRQCLGPAAGALAVLLTACGPERVAHDATTTTVVPLLEACVIGLTQGPDLATYAGGLAAVDDIADTHFVERAEAAFRSFCPSRLDEWRAARQAAGV